MTPPNQNHWTVADHATIAIKKKQGYKRSRQEKGRYGVRHSKQLVYRARQTRGKASAQALAPEQQRVTARSRNTVKNRLRRTSVSNRSVSKPEKRKTQSMSVADRTKPQQPHASSRGQYREATTVQTAKRARASVTVKNIFLCTWVRTARKESSVSNQQQQQEIMLKSE